MRELIERLEAEGSELFQLGTTYNYLAQIYVDARRPDLALPAADCAIELFENLDGDAARGNLSTALGDRANALTTLGRFEEALASAERGVAIDRERGDDRSVAAGLGRTAQIFAAQQRWTEADQRYGEALEAAREAGDFGLQGITVQHRATLQQERGNPARAIEFGKEALALFQQANHAGGEMQTCNLLGNAERAQGRSDAAEAWYARSRELAEARGDRYHLAALAQNVGILHQKRAEQTEDAAARDAHLRRAVGSIEESLDLKLEMGDQVGAAASYFQLGVLHRLLGDLDRADELLRQSLEIRESLNLPEVYKDYVNLAQVARDRGDEDAAAEWQTKYETKLAELERLRRGPDADSAGAAVSQELVQMTLALAQMVYAARTQGVALTPDVEEALANIAAAPEPFASLSRTLSALAAGENADVPSGLPEELTKIVEGLVEALGR